MTDEELKELVASLAIKSDRLDAQMQRTDEEIRRNSEEMRRNSEEMRRNSAEIKQFMHETSEVISRNSEENRRNNAEIKQFMQKTDEQIRETNATVKSVSTLLGNMGRNQGDITEEFFFNSLVENARLGSILFDDITRNDTKYRGKTQEEYDLFMTNGDAVGIIEVKYKAHETDLDKLERKMRNFKKLYPKYEDCKIYGALATFHIHEDLKKTTLERGFFILQQRGELIHTECGENLKVM